MNLSKIVLAKDLDEALAQLQQEDVGMVVEQNEFFCKFFAGGSLDFVYASLSATVEVFT